MMPIILGQLIDNKLTLSEIIQTLLGLYLKDNIISILKQNLTTNSITNRIIEASKQMTFNSLTVTPIPFTPLTPTTPTLSLRSPPSSVSSDSVNDSFRPDSGLFARNFSILHPFYPLMPPFGQKNQWFVPPMPPVPNHQRLAGL